MICIKPINNFILNRRGGIAIIFAIALFPVICLTGLAVDYSRALNLKNQITQATDAALLSTTNMVMQNINLSTIDENNKEIVIKMLEEHFNNFFLANMEGAIPHEQETSTINYDAAMRKVKIDIKVKYPTAMLKIASIDSWDIGITASTFMKTERKGSASILFVFDKSTSMRYPPAIQKAVGPTKMEALQTAANGLIAYLKQQDPEDKYIRTGAIAYEYDVTDRLETDWKVDRLEGFIRKLIPKGGTDMYRAMIGARKELKPTREQNRHRRKNGITPNLAVALMTDGEHGCAYTLNDEECADVKKWREDEYKLCKRMKRVKNAVKDLDCGRKESLTNDQQGFCKRAEEHAKKVDCFEREKLNVRMLKVCNSIKEKGIEIYTIAFATSESGEKLLRQCASDRNHYYSAKNANELTHAYRDIGESVVGKKNLALYE